MQILGKKSKVLLIAVAIAMLAALGLSFALWDTQAVKASNGNLGEYANAKVGDVITFGEYYQTGNKDKNDPTEYEKTPIEWLVVDKDERSGEITLMSKHILAMGSYFGNYYYNKANAIGWHYDTDKTEVAGISYNQAYVDSTVRAFLNNLERLDLGGDAFDAAKGYLPSTRNSSVTEGLLSSVGFSNQKNWTGLLKNTAAKDLPGFISVSNQSNLYYQRPIKNEEYKNRPATRGFFDEAFSDNEKLMIVPKQIAGYTGYRWPDNKQDAATKSYVEGAYDKVWLPSATELNIMSYVDKNNQGEDTWTSPSDEAGSTVFEYFKNYSQYKNPVTNTQNTSVADALKAARTPFAENGFAMNYSIPVYKKRNSVETGLTVNTDIHEIKNSAESYWTRSLTASWYSRVRYINLAVGAFDSDSTDYSNNGVRPCVILKY